jgi:hypothetical protein
MHALGSLTPNPQVEAMCELAGSTLRGFGYDPLTQNFPKVTRPPGPPISGRSSAHPDSSLAPHIHTQDMLSLPPYERCVRFLDNTPPRPPAGAAAPAASTPEVAPPVFTTVNRGASKYRV